MTELQKHEFYQILAAYWPDAKPLELDLLWRKGFNDLEFETAREICDAVKIESRYKSLPVKSLFSCARKRQKRNVAKKLYWIWYHNPVTGKHGACGGYAKNEEHARNCVLRWLKSLDIDCDDMVLFIGHENHFLYIQAQHNWNMQHTDGYAETCAKFASYNIREVVSALSGQTEIPF